MIQVAHDFRQRIDRSLQQLTDNLSEREPRELYEALTYMVSMGGKRLRPLLCVLSYSLFGDDVEGEVMKPALGLEIFHSFTLAHDDIMDKAHVRRGHLCLHEAYNPELAILAGDALSIYAFELMAQCPPQVLYRVIRMFTKTALEICEGQQMDLTFESRDRVTMSEYMHMISLKTAVFPACSTAIGAMCGGASRGDVEAMYDFGLRLGQGFQICDDYLDAFGDVCTFGKTIGGDIVNNKKTWLLVKAFSRADVRQRAELEKLLLLTDDPERKVNGVIRLYETLGIAEAALEEIATCHERAIASLEHTQGREEIKDALRSYCMSLTERVV